MSPGLWSFASGIAHSASVPARRKPLPPNLSDGLFLRSDALTRGVTPGVLRGPGGQRVVPGVYLAASVELSEARRVSALLRVLPPHTALDSTSALRWWGVDVGPTTPYRFVTTSIYHSKRADVRVRRVTQLPDRRGSVAAPVAALVAAKTELGLLDLVVAGDWLVQAGRASLPDVQRALQQATGRSCRRARRAGELVRARVESPRETRLRLMVVLTGLPEPECNVELGDEWCFIGRVDLYLRAWNIALEYEGDHHRTDAKTYGDDLRRYEQLAAAGVLAIRVSKDHMRRPREVVRRVHAALVSRGYDGPPPVWGDEWRALFE